MTKPLIPWMGGKRKLAATLLPMFPAHTCYVEPFCGAAALFFMKERAKAEVLNDTNGDLVNLYRVVQHHFQELYMQFKWCLASRQNFQWLLDTPVDILTDIQRAARFIYLQKLAFGGKVSGQNFGTATTTRPRLNLHTLERDLQDCHERLEGVYIEQKPWHEIVERYDRPHTLFYCDPPYWKVAGYGVDFPFSEYEKLADLAGSIKGTMIISVNGHPDIRKLFAGFETKAMNYTYTVGGAGKSGKAVELIISSRPGLTGKGSKTR